MLTAMVVTDILALRFILCFAQLALIVGGLINEIYALVFWNLVFLIFNGTKTYFLYQDRKPKKLPEDLAEIYNSTFSILKPREFMWFWAAGKQKIFKQEVILNQDDVNSELFYVVSGEAKVIKDDEVIATLKSGDFIAEMSYLAGENASATVNVQYELTARSWGFRRLKTIEKLDPNFVIKLQNILGKDLVNKLKNLS
jgi:hypothetical protein